MFVTHPNGEDSMKLQAAGEAEIDSSGTVSLPTEVLDDIGWKEGDRLVVGILDGERVVLSRRPTDIAAYFAGALTDLYPDPEDTRRFLDEGRGYTDEDDLRSDC
jgi:bifunctional DNA-binding transcriptional regulator/antitoxin component of YhaV-PrlF toxin-antitoxin module